MDRKDRARIVIRTIEPGFDLERIEHLLKTREARILFFLEARIFLSELGSGLRIFEQRLRRGVAREKIAHIGSALRNTLGNIGIVPEICCSDLGLEFFKFAFTFVDMEKTARITKALARCIKRDHRWKTSCIQSRVIPP